MNELDIIKLPVGPLQANAYLVHLRGEPESILIDPGDDHAQLLRAMDGRALRVTDILLTHGHFDHILSAAPIQREEGARVWIRADDAPMLESATASLYESVFAAGQFEPVKEVDSLPDGERVSFAGIDVEVIPCPGHTPGGASFYLPGQGALFTGDTLFVGGVGRTDFPGGDEGALYRSIETLLRLPPETIAYPGHGRSAPLSMVRGGFL